MTQQTEISYENRIVAYLDILGFKELVATPYPAVLKTIQELSNVQSGLMAALSGEEDLLSVRVFSDCICISAPLSDEGVSQLVTRVVYRQIWLATIAARPPIQGAFVRGAISLGRHYEDANMIFSEALVKAYQLEQEAIYPRVVVSEEVFQRIESVSDDVTRDALLKYVGRSPDGARFLDYLEALTSHVPDDRETLFSLHKASILQQMRGHWGSLRIVNKYLWLANYHNAKFQRFFGPSETRDRAEANRLWRKLGITDERP